MTVISCQKTFCWPVIVIVIMDVINNYPRGKQDRNRCLHSTACKTKEGSVGLCPTPLRPNCFYFDLKVVSLQSVPVHVGQNPVTYREAKTLLHSQYNGNWKKENGGHQAHLDPIWRLEQAQQTNIFRLRTWHCGLSAHLKRIGILDTSLCECGQADQTPDHVLLSCPKYAERRQITWPQGADLTTKLWGSAEDLCRTAGFVASTGLKI